MNILKNPATFVTIIVAFVVLAGLIAVLILFNHDPSTYVTSIGSLTVVVAGLLSVGVQQSKTDAKVDQAVSNTNGTLSAKQAKIDQLQQQNTALLASLVAQHAAPDPATAAQAVETAQAVQEAVPVPAEQAPSVTVPDLAPIPPLPSVGIVNAGLPTIPAS